MRMEGPERLKVLCTRRFKISDAFFRAGDQVLYNAQNKQSTFDIDNEEFVHKAVPAFSCHIAGCMTTFHSVQDYEAHYNSLHRHVCRDCKKLFPTNHLLEIHALESHDVLFKLMAEKQTMYQCLVEGCQDKFMNASERKVHLVKFHHYPHDFRFGRLQKDKKINQKTGNEADNPEIENMQTTEDTGEQTSKCLTVKYAPKVPKSICFGQGTSRGFMPRGRGMHASGKRRGKHWHQAKDEDMDTSVNIEEVNLKDLCNSLP